MTVVIRDIISVTASDDEVTLTDAPLPTGIGDTWEFKQALSAAPDQNAKPSGGDANLADQTGIITKGWTYAGHVSEAQTGQTWGWNSTNGNFSNGIRIDVSGTVYWIGKASATNTTKPKGMVNVASGVASDTTYAKAVKRIKDAGLTAEVADANNVFLYQTGSNVKRILKLPEKKNLLWFNSTDNKWQHQGINDDSAVDSWDVSHMLSDALGVDIRRVDDVGSATNNTLALVQAALGHRQPAHDAIKASIAKALYYDSATSLVREITGIKHVKHAEDINVVGIQASGAGDVAVKLTSGTKTTITLEADTPQYYAVEHVYSTGTDATGIELLVS